MKKLLTILVLFGFLLAYGQVGINTTTPKSTLDIDAFAGTSSVDGLLIPRVDRQRAENMTSIPISTMIYVNNISTGTQTGIGINIDSVGFYYFDGTSWRPINSPSSPTQGANVQKLRYLGPTDASRTLIVDGFYEVRFIATTATTVRFQVRLLSQPAANFVLIYNRSANYNGTTNAFSSTLTFTPTNYATWQDFDAPTTTAGVSYMYSGAFSSPERINCMSSYFIFY
ncbi:hypothetical protein OWR28_14765 [Chryseobacterium sp. 1B4]